MFVGKENSRNNLDQNRGKSLKLHLTGCHSDNAKLVN